MRLLTEESMQIKKIVRPSGDADSPNSTLPRLPATVTALRAPVVRSPWFGGRPKLLSRYPLRPKLNRPGVVANLQGIRGMSNLAKDVMTANPQCCSAETPLNEVAKLMVECDCGEIPVVDSAKKLVGVVTDRDIACRAVAKDLNTALTTAREIMTEPVISVAEDCSLDDVLATMEEHQIRRVPVLDAGGCVCGIISQADVALVAQESETGELVKELSRDSVH